MSNTTMVRRDLLIPPGNLYTSQIWGVMRDLHRAGLRYSSWWGTLDDSHIDASKLNKGAGYEPIPEAYDDEGTPWFALWEYAAVLQHVHEWPAGGRILDLGGSSSPLGVFLAMQGYDVLVLDRRQDAVENTDKIGVRLGIPLRARQCNLTSPPRVLGRFAVILDVSCLFTVPDRRVALDWLPTIATADAHFISTFDFHNPNPKRRITEPAIEMCPRGFSSVGEFVDRGERQLFYYPDPSHKDAYYTMGCCAFRRT